jgi:hypothetical protein
MRENVITNPVEHDPVMKAELNRLAEEAVKPITPDRHKD